MEYNLRPQWRQWTYANCQHPTCGRCGLSHAIGNCYAMQRQCFKCHKPGHYGRMCRKNLLSKNSSQEEDSKKKSKGKKVRDSKRISYYLDKKAMLRELPFSALRAGQFRESVLNRRDFTDHLKSKDQKFLKVNLEQSARINLLEERLKSATEELELSKMREKAHHQNLSETKELNSKLAQDLKCASNKEKELQVKLEKKGSAQNSELVTRQMFQIQDLQNQVDIKSRELARISKQFLEMQNEYELNLKFEQENVKKLQQRYQNSGRQPDLCEQCHYDQPYPASRTYYSSRHKRHFRGRGRF
ncbi:hypothetical protein FSP39_008673 [Pinctada imbricata]|uniref:CCHC-type domain-containing protein n=1 Tax=Pinctada imbricata TaxID=66713 RepID=A0AA89C9T4_PINIB|nr:hypothetical protein FSP39_008673 [Pinctada imbricata]